MNDIIVFNSTHKGASHYKSGKPCQDYSISHKADDGSLYVAIVCDGHGGDSYVRSDRGSRLAAEITLEVVKEFVANAEASLFIGKKGEVTARPEDDDPMFGSSSYKKLRNIIGDLTESQQQERDQFELFYRQVKDIHEQDKTFTDLFACIYNKWLAAIKQDMQDDPLTDSEKSSLGKLSFTKAYGSTLIAFVRTPIYWFAFHIGDGKCLACDRNFDWREPIPWDYKCFLNITTSLCNSNPMPAFRYSFDGTGRFPAAVVLGSDGLDDSWVTMQNLENFYSKILSLFLELGYADTMKELDEYLPRLSEKGSRDDMSVAGIVNMDAIREGIKVFELKKKRDSIVAQVQERDKELAVLQKNRSLLEESSQKLNAELLRLQQEKENALLAILKLKDDKEKEIGRLDAERAQKEEEAKAIAEKLDIKKEEHTRENNAADEKISQLEAECTRLMEENNQSEQASIDAWNQSITSYEEERIKRKELLRKMQSENMQNSSEEWMDVLTSADKKEEDGEDIREE